MGNLDSMLDELNNMENSITLRDENGEEVKQMERKKKSDI